jgi:UDP-N-acetylmuramoyl-tripeptide--D-alanyl-D-alanine ligase
MAFTNDKITFGCKKLYDLIGQDEKQSDLVAFRYTTRYGEKDFKKLPVIKTRIFGQYNLYNCLAAACIGTYFKVEESAIREALETYVPDMNRSQLIKTETNTIILDAYNANPDSMKAALQNFALYPAENKMLLLGDMFELGEYAAIEHQTIVDMARSLGFAEVIFVGKEFGKLSVEPFLKFETTAEAFQYLQGQNLVAKTILIKGSRSMKMETLQQAL